ncbi:hypothetical protein [Streptomyces europaeiscabiei]|nr:hypothetical protein [Streptomyces europaeiscabiei]MDX3585244.1 hypothetical protein [Streptomyces europaeiscabiei]MDX3616771.1 hypothetical protein [Streptomyces europaeiscabiei]
MPHEDIYAVLYTESAARDRDRLDPMRRASFDRRSSCSPAIRTPSSPAP